MSKFFIIDFKKKSDYLQTFREYPPKFFMLYMLFDEYIQYRTIDIQYPITTSSYEILETDFGCLHPLFRCLHPPLSPHILSLVVTDFGFSMFDLYLQYLNASESEAVSETGIANNSYKFYEDGGLFNK